MGIWFGLWMIGLLLIILTLVGGRAFYDARAEKEREKKELARIADLENQVHDLEMRVLDRTSDSMFWASEHQYAKDHVRDLMQNLERRQRELVALKSRRRAS